MAEMLPATINYVDAEQLIQDGSLVHYQGVWKFSKWIRIWTKSPITHVSIAFWLHIPAAHGPASKELFIIESVPSGVRIVPYRHLVSKYLKHGARVFWSPLVGGDGTRIVRDAIVAIGRDYPSKFEMFLVMFPWARRVYELFFKMEHKHKRFTCSEFVAQALMSAGYPYGKEAVTATPEDVTMFAWYPNKVELVA